MRSMDLFWPTNASTIPVNEEVNLTCTSEYSRPPAQFRWFKGDLEITNQANYSVSNTDSDGRVEILFVCVHLFVLHSIELQS